MSIDATSGVNGTTGQQPSAAAGPGTPASTGAGAATGGPAATGDFRTGAGPAAVDADGFPISGFLPNEHITVMGAPSQPSTVSAYGSAGRSLLTDDPAQSVSPTPDVQVSGVGPGGGAYSVRATGGVWANNGAAALDPSLAPQIAHPEVLNVSLHDAQQLTAGKNVNDILGENPTEAQKNALGDAFEVLGISNRQLTQLANNVGIGGIDAGLFRFGSPAGTAAQDALGTAVRARASVDPSAADELKNHSDNVLLQPLVQGTPPKYPQFSADGAIDAVQAGATASGKYFSPEAATRDLLFGGNGISGAFKDRGFFERDYSGSIADGATTLKGTQIDADLPPEIVKKQAERIFGQPGPVDSSDAAIRTVASGLALQRGLEGDVAGALAAQPPGSPFDQQAAIAGALKKNGIDLTPDQVSNRLYDAVTSPQFDAYLAGLNPDDRKAASSEALGTLGFFNSDLEASAAASHDLGEATGGALTGRALLAAAKTTTPAQALAQATPDERGTATAAVAAEALGAARFLNGAAGVPLTAVDGQTATRTAVGILKMWNDPAFKANPASYLLNQLSTARLNTDSLPGNVAFSNLPGGSLTLTDGDLGNIRDAAGYMLKHGVDGATSLFTGTLAPLLAAGSLAAHAANANSGTIGDKIETGVKIAADGLSILGGAGSFLKQTAPLWGGVKNGLNGLALGAWSQSILTPQLTSAWGTLLGNAASTNLLGAGNLLYGGAGFSNSIRGFTNAELTKQQQAANGAQFIASLANLHNGALTLGLAALYRSNNFDPLRAQRVSSLIGATAALAQIGLQVAG